MREIDIIKEDIRCCDDFDVYPNASILCWKRIP